MVLCLPLVYSKYLYRLSIFSGFYGFYRRYWDLACVPLGVGLNSLNYWRYPDYSWRRYVDIGYIVISCMWQCLRALEAENRLIFYFILGLSMLSFYPAVVLS